MSKSPNLKNLDLPTRSNRVKFIWLDVAVLALKNPPPGVKRVKLIVGNYKFRESTIQRAIHAIKNADSSWTAMEHAAVICNEEGLTCWKCNKQNIETSKTDHLFWFNCKTPGCKKPVLINDLIVQLPTEVFSAVLKLMLKLAENCSIETSLLSITLPHRELADFLLGRISKLPDYLSTFISYEERTNLKTPTPQQSKDNDMKTIDPPPPSAPAAATGQATESELSKKLGIRLNAEQELRLKDYIEEQVTAKIASIQNSEKTKSQIENNSQKSTYSQITQILHPRKAAKEEIANFKSLDEIPDQLLEKLTRKKQPVPEGDEHFPLFFSDFPRMEISLVKQLLLKAGVNKLALKDISFSDAGIMIILTLKKFADSVVEGFNSVAKALKAQVQLKSKSAIENGLLDVCSAFAKIAARIQKATTNVPILTRTMNYCLKVCSSGKPFDPPSLISLRSVSITDPVQMDTSPP